GASLPRPKQTKPVLGSLNICATPCSASVTASPHSWVYACTDVVRPSCISFGGKKRPQAAGKRDAPRTP
ncbi:MAG: hypothetical protein IK079_06050, partial [Desulfovibrio sp.]|nr:hypothetical protein [Desulfovibrio sp.]